MMRADQIELLAQRTIRPQLRDRDLMRRRQAARGVIRLNRHVEMEGRPGTTEMHPLRHRLEIVHGLGALDFDDASDLAAGHQDEVRKYGKRTALHGRQLLVTHVDQHLVLPLVFSLELTNQPIVLELLANRTDKDRRHLASMPELGRLPDLDQSRPDEAGGRPEYRNTMRGYNYAMTSLGFILVVDDDLAVGQTFARMLTVAGYETATVSSAAAGLESVRQRRPDAPSWWIFECQSRMA